MIKPEMVPDNVEEHFRWCAANTDMTTRECLAAALSVWPGVNTDAVRCGTLILHLPKEPPNDKA